MEAARRCSSRSSTRKSGCSDEEWNAILTSGSFKVLEKGESAMCRQRFPERMVSGRMVGRWKPQESTFSAPTSKSRWCVKGHQDPDVGKLETYSPTPQTGAIMTFLLLAQPMDMRLVVAGCKNAFCPSARLQWPQGRAFAELCVGLPVDGGCLIEFVAPAYWLTDAPLLWHRTMSEYLTSIGLRHLLLDSCLYIRGKGQGISDIILRESTI